ncbi:MAG: AAA family ATPase [Desulfurivibrio sp.]|nr:AAA family ATPase [Desulfurivibrio sp.]MBU3937303.1 sigma 54-interacting transcriptional regulator [Pseudomonadota bacterium]MBU4119336.1 sigma 54-interacting transcriptional regulator [Pseudomonadota bacterium]
MASTKKKSLQTPTALRRKAEKQLQTEAARLHAPQTREDLQRLVHELEVHRIELEMQNAELRRTQEELELSRDKYSELYDFSPIAYFTFDADGLIREINFSGAQLLGMERRQLLNKPFVHFISDADGKAVFSDHLKDVLQKQIIQRCEIGLRRNIGTVIPGQFQSIAVDAAKHGDGCIFTSIVDVTCHRQLEIAMQQAYDSLDGTVRERTTELTKANQRLSNEIDDRKATADSLREALEIIKQLKEQLRAENLYLRDEIDQIYAHMDFVGESGAVRAVLKQVGQVAPTGATVLIQGETGTGKELLAHAVHNQSGRRDRLMITVNCAALPPTLIESELFGREKGAFTGALARQIGRFELADGSTIFLDEIDALPLDLQAKLLRVLESGEFERLGNPRTIKVDVRIISATNRDLAGLVSSGDFRQDMFYRLNVFQILVPPLRERREDILPLVWFFVQEFGKKMGKRIESISPKSVEVIQTYSWPGNVRELRNVTERAMIVSNGSTLHLDLPKTASPVVCQAGTLEDLERNHIVDVLDSTGWRVSGKSGAATILGLNPKTLESRMQKLGIQRNKRISDISGVS